MLLKINRLSDGGENDTKMHLYYSGLLVCYRLSTQVCTANNNNINDDFTVFVKNGLYNNLKPFS